MRASVSALAIALTLGCTGTTLYTHLAGPAPSAAPTVYECVQEQMKTLGYGRKQYDQASHLYVGEKVTHEGISDGLYKQTLHVLETRVKEDGASSTLDIVARTYNVFATVRGDDRQEVKASDRVQLDAKALGQACTK